MKKYWKIIAATAAALGIAVAVWYYRFRDKIMLITFNYADMPASVNLDMITDFSRIAVLHKADIIVGDTENIVTKTSAAYRDFTDYYKKNKIKFTSKEVSQTELDKLMKIE
jgi:hypothetical protein